MIECKVNKGESTVMANGTTVELAAELALLIGRIYDALKADNPGNADYFRTMLQVALFDDSPTWNVSHASGVTIVSSRSAKEEN